jgi:hypothetical protein
MRYKGALAALALLAFLTAGCSSGSSGLPLSEDFSNDCRWPREEAAGYTLGCTNGAYQVVVRRGSERFAARELGAATAALHLEIDTRINKGDDATFSGLGCWAAEKTGGLGAPDGSGYAFLVGKDGSFAVVRVSGGSLSAGRMLAGRGSGAIEWRRGGNRIEADCVRDKDVTTLALRLNDIPLAVARDGSGGEPFTWAGLVVSSRQTTADLRFDDFEAGELSEQQARAIAARVETPEENVVRLPYEDDLAGVCEWTRNEEVKFSIDCTDGEYVVALKRSFKLTPMLGLDRKVEALRIGADVSVADAGPERDAAYGLSCWTGTRVLTAQPADGPGYAFVTAPDEGWAIWQESEDESPKLLLLGLPGSVPQRERTNRIEGDCVNEGGKTTLVLRINGTPVAIARRRAGTQFGWIAFVVTTQTTAEVHFDNVEARQLTGAEAHAVTELEATPTPTGDPFADAQLRRLGLEIQKD